MSMARAADAQENAAVKKELELLQGAWKVTSAERDGKPDDLSKNAVITFTKDSKLTVKLADGKSAASSFKLDPAQKPKAIDYTPTDGPDKGKTHLGIYSLEGDTLKICRADAGKERPKDFTTKADSARMLFVLQRDKPTPLPIVSPFTDKNLEAVVKEELKHSKGELSDSNLANVYFLNASGKKITNLKGLEKCPNLAELNLANNQITDLTPLKDLKNLQSLTLTSNKIADLGPLSGLAKLQYLELSNNQVAKLDPLSGLSSLSSLYLTGNKISDLTPLGSLIRLSSLSLGKNQIRDLSALAKVNKLRTLELIENQIEDLTPLAKQTELGILMLDKNQIKDLTPLVAAAKADAEGPKRFAPYLELYLAGNPLSDAAKAEQLATLKKIGVRVKN